MFSVFKIQKPRRGSFDQCFEFTGEAVNGYIRIVDVLWMKTANLENKLAWVQNPAERH